MPQTACEPTVLEAADRWACRKLGNVRHERRVLAIAEKLADLLGDRLGLTAGDVDLLRLAAVTHDVGRHVSEKDHPQRGAEMIATTSALDLSPGQRRRLAFLARYHRGAVPPEGKEEYLRPSDRRPGLRAVLAVLRTADALDSRHLSPPRLLLRLTAGGLAIECAVASHLAEARRIYPRPKKYRLLESLLGHAVRVTVTAQ